MNYDHEPRPEIERHYHVRELIESQERKTAERARLQEIEKNRDSNLKDIIGFNNIENLDFWCNRCKVDFVGRARKQIDTWGPIAYYKIKHWCGAWTMRHITDRFRDLYFFKSKKVALDRGKAFMDTLQPFQTGFNTIYGKK